MTQPQGVNVSVDQLMILIGKLTVENAILKEQIAQLSTFSNQVVVPSVNGKDQETNGASVGN